MTLVLSGHSIEISSMGYIFKMSNICYKLNEWLTFEFFYYREIKRFDIKIGIEALLLTRYNVLKMSCTCEAVKLIVLFAYSCKSVIMRLNRSCGETELFRFLPESISWLLIPWFLASPGHQHPWYWLCRIGKFVSYMRKDSKCLYLLTVEEWYKLKINVYFPSEKLKHAKG